MLKHNIKIFLRNIKRHKFNFVINLVGLSSGLICVLMIYLWVADEMSADKFHVNDETLYKVMRKTHYSEEIDVSSSTPGLLAEALKDQIPDIDNAVSTTWIINHTLSANEKILKERGFYVGSAFFNLFSFDLITGHPDVVLEDKNSIVISEELAIKLFNSIDVVGESILHDNKKEFIVSGVFKNVPDNSSLQFEFVLSYEVFKENHPWQTSWENNGPYTYVTLSEKAHPKDVESKISDFISKYDAESESTLFLKKYSDHYLYGKYQKGIQSGGRIEYVRLFILIALIILVVASINFVNLSTAHASIRAKEIGVKKTFGATRKGLFWQYIFESSGMVLISMIVSLIVAALLIPSFNELTNKSLSLNFQSHLSISIVIIVILTSIFAGVYPAVYLSGLRELKLLKSKLKGTFSEFLIRKVLVVFQFAVSAFLILGIIVIYKQITYMQNKDLGYDKEGLVSIIMSDKIKENLETFLTEIKRIPGVVNAGTMGHSLSGRSNNSDGLSWKGKNPEDRIVFEHINVNQNLKETIGLEIVEGRWFSNQLHSDTSKIILNEAAIRSMGLKKPIGQVVSLWDTQNFEIIGVVKDFNFQSLHNEVQPAYFVLAPEYTWNLVLRIDEQRESNTLSEVEILYKDFNPGFQFDYRFIEDSLNRRYRSEITLSTLSKYFVIITILISVLGLFGLATFNAERRVKEIGIRKVLGASASQIMILLSREYIILMLISSAIGLTIGYFVMNNWLSGFAYRIEINIVFIALTLLTMIAIGWFAVSKQSVRASRINPVDCLKTE